MSDMPLNSENKPMSVMDWIIVFLLIGIPVLGIVLVVYWSFGESVNINKKNFSKAMLILFVLTFLLAMIFALFFGQLFSELNRGYNLHSL